jgi:hypothetical protein
MSDLKCKILPKQKVIEMLDQLETLKDISDVGYNLNIFKQRGEAGLYVSANISIEMMSEQSSDYIESIHKCHNILENMGFQNTRLESGNDMSRISRAYLWSEMAIK